LAEARRVASETTKEIAKIHPISSSARNAVDLEAGVFKHRDPRVIALSLKRSAETSDRRRSSPYRSAMSMLTFYINRAGKGLPEPQKRVLELAKDVLRKAFGRD
jgi:hypothetical protein